MGKPDELPIIQRTYDLILWYVPRLNKLPRNYKYATGSRRSYAAFSRGSSARATPARHWGEESNERDALDAGVKGTDAHAVVVDDKEVAGGVSPGFGPERLKKGRTFPLLPGPEAKEDDAVRNAPFSEDKLTKIAVGGERNTWGSVCQFQ